jgi:glucose/arabinose dehydrogenase
MPDDYRVEPVIRGLDQPQAFAATPDGRVLFLERQTGRVRVIKHGKLLAQPLVQVAVSTSGEEGLLGIAVHPDFATNGWLYLYYTQAAPKTNRIVRYTVVGDAAGSAATILDNIGFASNGEDNGGGLTFGVDGKLYAGVGVLAVDGNAGSMGSLAGKVLRINDNGGVPADNPNIGLAYPYNLIYAKGFRNVADLTVNENSGTLYGVDNYDTNAACDEVNVVRSGLDYGWNVASCGNGGQAPLHVVNPQIGVSASAANTGTKYTGFEDDLFVAGASGGTILRDDLTGAAFDTLSSSNPFYDPAGQSNCPTTWKDLGIGDDGWLYALSADSSSGKAGIYRAIYDPFGLANAKPREVSSTPYLPLSVARDGSGLRLFWEDLKREAWGCTNTTTPKHCPTGSKETKYSVWQGNLDAPFAYSHAVLAETNGDGTQQTDALRSYGIASMPAGNKYFLLSARGANLEGSTGRSSAGAERPGYAKTDLCGGTGGIPTGNTLDQCSTDWAHSYPDQNNENWTLADFRGRTVLLAFHQFG